MTANTLRATILGLMSREWKSRSALAKDLNQTRLYPYDIAILDELVSEGELEHDDHPRGIVATKHVYRLPAVNQSGEGA